MSAAVYAAGSSDWFRNPAISTPGIWRLAALLDRLALDAVAHHQEPAWSLPPHLLVRLQRHERLLLLG